MALELISPPTTYRVKEFTETAYLRARDQWDDRIGQSVVQAKNWRITCLLSLFICLFMLVALIYQASLNKVVPMVIAVDRLSGEPKIIGKVTEIGYRPQEQEIKYFLNQFVLKVRTVPQDPVIIKQNWLEAYQFMRQQAAIVLNDQTQNDVNSPLKKIGEMQVVVQPISITKVNQEGESYQVRWNETIYGKSGEKLESYTMNGIFSIEFDIPVSEKALNINPLGLFIKSFQWTKELTGGSKK